MTDLPPDIESDLSNPPEPLITQEPKHRLPLTHIFELGIYLEYLRMVPSIKPIAANDVILPLREMYEILQRSDIDSAVVEQVGSYHYKISEEYESAGEKLTDEIKTDISVKATTWKHLLARELSQENRIPVDDTGLLKIDSLIDSPEDLFADVVWDWLDDRPQADIREACRCIVIGCSTASVMMSLRAVEHCLRKWYEEEHEEIEATWGRVLDQLMEEYTEEEKRNDTVLTQLSDLPPVLSNLYYLKEKRNEVSHPDQSPDPQEARRTLMIVASTISEIHDELREVAAKEAEEQIQGTVPFFVSDAEKPMEEITDENNIGYILAKLENKRNGDPIPKSDLVEIACKLGMSEEELDDILMELMMSGRLYEPSDKEYKLI